MIRKLLLVLVLLVGCAQQALAIGFAGNFSAGSLVYITFNSYDNQSNLTTLVSGTVKCYKDNNTTESTAGITLTTDFDSRTGFHLVVVDTSADGTFYAAGHDFECVLTAGTVKNTSVIGSVVGTFSLQNRYNTVTANVTQWNGSNIATPDTAGYPKVTIKDGTGTGEIDTTSGQVIASSVQGNVTGSVASVTGGVTVTTNNDKTGYSLSATGADAALPSATVQSDAGNSTTQAKTNRTESTSSYWKDALVLFTGGGCNIVGQVAKITAYDGSTKIITWSPAKTATPTTSCGLLFVNR